MKASALVLLAVLATPTHSVANPPEEMFGASPRVKGMGGAGTAATTDFSAVFFNPANLSRCPRSSLTIAYDLVDYGLTVHDHTDNTAIRADAPDADLRPEALRPINSLTLGVCAKLPAGIGVGFHFVQGIRVPAALSQTTTNGTPRFVLYGQRLESMSLMTAAGIAIGRLSVGAGISILADTNVTVGTNLSVLAGDNPPETPFTYAYRMGRETSFQLGATFDVLDELAVALTYRHPISHTLDATVPVQVRSPLIRGGEPLTVQLRVGAVAWFSPRQLALGAVYQVSPRLTVAADLTWLQWSAYPGPFIYPIGELIIDPELVGTVELTPPPAESAGFHDIVTPRIGAEYASEAGWVARAGYGWRPTPAAHGPRARANLLDGDVHTFSGGVGYQYEFGADETSATVAVDLFGSIGLMPRRAVRKEDTNTLCVTFDPERAPEREPDPTRERDPACLAYDDYDFGGQIYNFGVAITVEF